MSRTRLLTIIMLTACGGAGATSAPQQPTPQQPAPPPPPPAAAPFTDTLSFDRVQYASTYQRRPNPPVLIRNANVFTGVGPEQRGVSVLFQDGKIVGVGSNLQAPAGAQVVDGTNKWVTPGIIDTHSHIGVYAAPGTQAESDGNEATNPNTARAQSQNRSRGV